jgi:hypothetical protein
MANASESGKWLDCPGKQSVRMMELSPGEIVAYIFQHLEERRWPSGTVLVVPSDVPPFFHFLMVEYVDFHTGVEWAIHNIPGIGVAREPLDNVIRGRRVQDYWSPETTQAGEEAILRLQSLIGHPYDLIEANCEHVIRWAVTGEWKSEQVSTIKVGLLAAGAVALACSL